MLDKLWYAMSIELFRIGLWLIPDDWVQKKMRRHVMEGIKEIKECL